MPLLLSANVRFCPPSLDVAGLFSEELEKRRPTAGRAHSLAHAVAALAVSIEVTVHEIDARLLLSHGGERDLHFTRLREIRLELPLGSDLPCNHETMRWIPREHSSPRTFGAFFLLGVAASTD